MRSGDKIHSNPTEKRRIHQLRGIIKRKEAFSSKEPVVHQLRRNIKRWTKCFHQKNLKYPNFKAARIEAFLQSSDNTNYNHAQASLLFFIFHEILGLLDKFLTTNKAIFCLDKKSTVSWSKSPPFKKCFYVWQSCFLSLWSIL